MAGVFTNQSGRNLTKGLFFETTMEDKTGVSYTLKDRDYKGFPSLYLLYMKCGDLTEYEFANKYLSGWSQWQTLCETSWFKEFVDRWRWELELRTKSEGLRRIIEESTSEGKNKYNANKFLVEGGWMAKVDTKSAVGRPTKERIKQEAERLNQIEREILEDHGRLN